MQFPKMRRHQKTKSRRWIILLSIIAFLILGRILLPTAIKIGLNNYLEDFSPNITGHVSDVDLAIIRGHYAIDGIEASLKKKDKTFLKVGSIKAHLPWKNIFAGKPVADVAVVTADFDYHDDVLKGVKAEMQRMEAKKDKDEDKDKEPPLKINRFDLRDSKIRTSMFPKLTGRKGVILKNIEAVALNITPDKKSPETSFKMKAKLLNSGEFLATGEALLLRNPPQWTVDHEIHHFDLTSLNAFLKQKVPMTFTKGTMDLYAEASSEGKAVKGYLKPFIRDLDVVKSKEKFVSSKHFLAEIISALGNITFKSGDETSTMIPFVYDGQFKPEAGQGLAKIIEHAFQDEPEPKLENKFGLPGSKQAQEDNDDIEEKKIDKQAKPKKDKVKVKL